MNSSIIKKLVEEELARGESFTNLHGITRERIRSFLVEPFAVRIDPDDLETQPRDMWLVLRERPAAKDGYIVVFDPETSAWGVAERTGDDSYTLTVSAPSFAGALESM